MKSNRLSTDKNTKIYLSKVTSKQLTLTISIIPKDIAKCTGKAKKDDKKERENSPDYKRNI